MNKDLEKLSALYDGELPSKEMQDSLAEMHADENLKEIFQKLCPTPIMASRWADLVQVQSKNLNHGLSVNLDPGSLILDTFFRIQDCAEAVR